MQEWITLVVLIVMALGWFNDHNRLSARVRQLERRLGEIPDGQTRSVPVANSAAYLLDPDGNRGGSSPLADDSTALEASRPAAVPQWSPAVWIGSITIALGGSFLAVLVARPLMDSPIGVVVAGYLLSMALFAVGKLARRSFPTVSDALVSASLTIAYANSIAAHAVQNVCSPWTSFALAAAIAAAAATGWLIPASTFVRDTFAVIGVLGALLAPILVNLPPDFPVAATAGLLSAGFIWLGRHKGSERTAAAAAFGILCWSFYAGDAQELSLIALFAAPLLASILATRRSVALAPWETLMLAFAAPIATVHFPQSSELGLLGGVAFGLAAYHSAPGARQGLWVLAAGAAVLCVWSFDTEPSFPLASVVWPVAASVTAALAFARRDVDRGLAALAALALALPVLLLWAFERDSAHANVKTLAVSTALLFSLCAFGIVAMARGGKLSRHLVAAGDVALAFALCFWCTLATGTFSQSSGVVVALVVTMFSALSLVARFELPALGHAAVLASLAPSMLLVINAESGAMSSRGSVIFLGTLLIPIAGFVSAGIWARTENQRTSRWISSLFFLNCAVSLFVLVAWFHASSVAEVPENLERWAEFVAALLGLALFASAADPRLQAGVGRAAAHAITFAGAAASSWLLMRSPLFWPGDGAAASTAGLIIPQLLVAALMSLGASRVAWNNASISQRLSALGVLHALAAAALAISVAMRTDDARMSTASPEERACLAVVWGALGATGLMLGYWTKRPAVADLAILVFTVLALKTLVFDATAAQGVLRVVLLLATGGTLVAVVALRGRVIAAPSATGVDQTNPEDD